MVGSIKDPIELSELSELIDKFCWCLESGIVAICSFSCRSWCCAFLSTSNRSMGLDTKMQRYLYAELRLCSASLLVTASLLYALYIPLSVESVATRPAM